MAALSQTPANVVASQGAAIESGVFGSAVSAGMCIYRDTTDDKKLKPARCNTLVTSVVAGVAVYSGSSGQPSSYVTSGRINLGAVLLRGEVYVVSDDVAGQIIPYGDLEDGSTDYVSIIGVAISPSILQLCIVPTEVTLDSH